MGHETGMCVVWQKETSIKQVQKRDGGLCAFLCDIQKEIYKVQWDYKRDRRWCQSKNIKKDLVENAMMLHLNSIPFRAYYTDWHFVSTMLPVSLQIHTHRGMPLTHIRHTLCSTKGSKPNYQAKPENRGFLKRIPKEAEELMEDLMQFSLLFFSCLDLMWWVMNSYEKNSPRKHRWSAKEKSWMKEGLWKSVLLVLYMYAAEKKSLVVIKQPMSCFSCHCCSNLAVVHSCETLQGQIQSLSLLFWPHLTDRLSQQSYLSVSLKLFSV